MRPLRTLLVSDGKPGHYHLAEGICSAIARRRPVELTQLQVARPRWLPGRAVSAITNAGLALTRVLPSSIGTRSRPVDACDLVISAGGDTLAANIAMSRTYGCPNIFYGSLRRYDPADFSLVLTSYAANSDRPNHAWALKPSAFDPDTLPPADLATTNPVIGVLIGGDSGTIRYRSYDWRHLRDAFSPDAPHGDALRPTWIVSNSRRTPDQISDQFVRLAEFDPGRVRFIDVRKPGGMTLTELFAACCGIAVTLDSSSMISEAVWSRRPVAVLRPAGGGSLPQLEQSYRDQLQSQGRTIDVALVNASPQALLAAFKQVRPLSTNPLDGLADLLAQRLPQLFGTLNPTSS